MSRLNVFNNKIKYFNIHNNSYHNSSLRPRAYKPIAILRFTYSRIEETEYPASLEVTFFRMLSPCSSFYRDELCYKPVATQINDDTGWTPSQYTGLNSPPPFGERNERHIPLYSSKQISLNRMPMRVIYTKEKLFN